MRLKNHKAEIQKKVNEIKKDLINMMFVEIEEQKENKNNVDEETLARQDYDNLTVIKRINNLEEAEIISFALNTLNENFFDEILFEIKNNVKYESDEMPF